MHFSTRLFAPLALALGAAAHGYLGTMSVDGKAYKGNGDGGDPSSTVIRPTKPNDVGPVKGATNPDMKCGLSPVTNAALVAEANPGSTVDVLWVGEGGAKWIHEVGPVMHYMAECTGVSDCTTFDPTNAKWFKIDQKGLKSDGKTWFMADIFNGQPVSLTIPENLKAGNYLLRSELIALHNAVSEGGAEFYPNCAQLKVGGSGTGTPDTTVAFPGAYSDTDPGIIVPDIYNPGFTYTFPGGAVATISGGSSGSSSASSSGDSGDASSAPAAASSATAAATTSVAPSAATTAKAASGGVTTSAAAVVPSASSAPSSSGSGSSLSGSNSTSSGSGSSSMCKNRRRRDVAQQRRAKAVRAHAAARALHGHS